jgi:MFS superfamily sulfate permease-like transporter
MTVVKYNMNKYHNGETSIEIFGYETRKFHYTTDTDAGLGLIGLVIFAIWPLWPITIPVLVFAKILYALNILRIKDYVSDD